MIPGRLFLWISFYDIKITNGKSIFNISYSQFYRKWCNKSWQGCVLRKLVAKCWIKHILLSWIKWSCLLPIWIGSMLHLYSKWSEKMDFCQIFVVLANAAMMDSLHALQVKLLLPFLIVPRAKIQSMTKAKGCVAKIFLLMLPVLLPKFYSVAIDCIHCFSL